MATVHDKRTGNANSPPAKVSEHAERVSGQLVEARLAAARKRIRTLQVYNALLVFALITTAYLAIIITCGHLGRFIPVVQLSLLAKQSLFVVYLGAVLAWLGFGLIRPLFRVVNPYYAARHLEQVVPNSKNSIINWLDLRRRDLPSSIRAALSKRAAGDLGKADVTQAISGRSTVRLAALCGLLVLGLVVFLGALTWFHYPALALVRNAFPPFGPSALPTRTQLEIIEPLGGNLTLTIPQPVRIEVRLSGRRPDPRSPDAVRLLLRSDRSAAFEEWPMESKGGEDWHATIPLSRVEAGFFYKVAGGDAETDEHRVLFLPAPVITKLDVKLKYRPYVCRPDLLLDGFDGNIKAIRGTEVTLTAHTNCSVVEGDLVLEPVKGKGQSLPAEVLPNGMRFRFVLDQNGTYRIHFKARQQGIEGPVDRDAVSRRYSMEADADQPPSIFLTKPEPETIALPANGLLSVEGWASDDIGVKEIALHMKLDNGPTLKPKPYRPKKSFRRPDGSYPVSLAYKDFVELGKVTDAAGKPITLKPGMRLEYWLEATDNCDYPHPNKGESKHQWVKIVDPQTDQQQQQQRDQAQGEQQKYEADQDKQLQQDQQPSEDKGQKSEAKDQQGTGQDKQEAKGQQGNGQDKQEAKGQQGNGQDKQEAKGQQGNGQDKQEAKGQQGNGQDKQEAKGQQGNGQDKQEAKGQQGTGQDKQEAKGQQGNGQDKQEAKGQQGQKVDDKPQKKTDGSQKAESKPQQGSDGSQKAENQGRKAPDGDRKAENKPQHGTNGGQKVEDKGQKGTDSGQKGEAKGQKAPDGGQKPEKKGQEPAKTAEPSKSDRVERSRGKLDELVKALEERDKQQATKGSGKEQEPEKKPKEEDRSPQSIPSDKPTPPKGAKDKDQAAGQQGLEKKPKEEDRSPQSIPSDKPAPPKGAKDKDQAAGPADQRKPQQEKKQPDAGASDSQQPADQKQPEKPGKSEPPSSKGSDPKPAKHGDSSPPGSDKAKDQKPRSADGSDRDDAKEQPSSQKPTKDGQPGKSAGKPQDGKPSEAKDKPVKPSDLMDTPPDGSSPDPRHQEKAGELQLERRIAQLRDDLKKQLDAMSPEERNKLFEQAGLTPGKQPSGEIPQPQTDRARKELERILATPLPSRGARPALPGQTSPGDVKRGGDGQPPAEFREAYYNFLRKLAETPEK